MNTPVFEIGNANVMFIIEANGDIMLRGEKIGHDEELAELCAQYGKQIKTVGENIEKQGELIDKITQQL